ncbi:hypothetical protein BDZ90DRAFT_205437, partial [Jaminaea rosea]
LAAIGMAVGAPLIYADQAHSMAKVRDSTGFSKDVCAVVLLSNIARLVWWFHERYELVLVVQSCLMVVAQIALLSLVLRFQPGSYASSALRADGSSSGRPFGFWTWTSLESYIVFLVCYTLFLLALQITIGRVSSMYNALLGLYALGLESTLPLPQLIANQKRRSLAGFRLSVLAGWSLGDLFKVVYFLFLKPGSPFQFLAGALFSLSVDIGIVAQAKMFAEKTAED